MVIIADYGLSMAIIGFHWQLRVFNGKHGLTLFLCIHVHLIHFFTIDPLGSKLMCYLFLK